MSLNVAQAALEASAGHRTPQASTLKNKCAIVTGTISMGRILQIKSSFVKKYSNKFVHVQKKLYFCGEICYRDKYPINKITIMAYKIGEDCIACGTCKDECPMGAISEGERYSIDPDVCTECGTCADVCPSGAISL